MEVFHLDLPGLREVWGFTSLESNLKVGATLGDVGPLDPSFEATRCSKGERSGWVEGVKPITEVFWGVYMDVSKNGGTQQPWVFLLKMIILGCFGRTTIFGNIHIEVIPYYPIIDYRWVFVERRSRKKTYLGCVCLVGGFHSYFFMFTPKIGEDVQFDEHIFQWD